MKLTVLHLSDAHFHPEMKDNPVHRHVSQLAEIASTRVALSQATALLIVFSGDVANRGQPKEYDRAREYLQQLTSLLAEKCGDSVDLGICVIPGNHDCNLEYSDDGRRRLISSIAEDLQKSSKFEVDESTLNTCCRPFSDFHAFANSLSAIANSGELVEYGPVLRLHRYRFKTNTIGILSYNSAWAFLNKGQDERTYFIPSADDVKNTECELVFGATHYPHTWNPPPLAKEMLRFFYKTSRCVFLGHEHDPFWYKQDCPMAAGFAVFHGSALQSRDSRDTPGFTLFDIQSKSGSSMAHYFVLDREDDKYREREDLAVTFNVDEGSGRRLFELNPSYVEELRSTGIPVLHPSLRVDVSLQELYVYPSLRLYPRVGPKMDKSAKVRSFELVYSEDKKFIVTGTHLSGKSATCKYLILNQLAANKVPLMVSGRALTSTDEHNLQKLIKRAYGQQYLEAKGSYFDETGKEQRVLLIDDVQHSPLSRSQLDEIINYYDKVFSHIVVFGDEYLLTLSLDGDGSGASPLTQWPLYEVLPLGKKLQEDFIRKWMSIGPGPGDTRAKDPKSITSRRHSIVRGVVSLGLPTFPLYLVAALSLETGGQSAAKEATQGHLVQALITLSLGSHTGSEATFGEIRAFLAELAWEMFKCRKVRLTEGHIVDMTAVYQKKYHVEVNLREILDVCLKSRILKEQGDRFFFSHRHIRHFFTAWRISDKLSVDDECRAAVKTLSKSWASEAHAGTLMFLCYLCKDVFIYDTVLASLEGLLAGDPEADMESQLPFSGPDAPEDVVPRLSETDSTSHRIARVRHEDEREALVVDCWDIDEDEEFPEVVPDKSGGLVSSLKAVEATGQLLRAFHIDFLGEQKAKILEAAFRLALRSLGGLYARMAHDKDLFIQFLKRQFDAAKRSADSPLGDSNDGRAVAPQSRQVTDEMVTKTMYVLCLSLAFIVGRNVGESFGDGRLNITLREITQGDRTIVWKIFGLACKLNVPDTFPEKEAFDLLDEAAKKSIAARDLVKVLVWYHLYLFDVPSRQFDRIVTKFEFKDVNQLMDARSKRS